MRPTLLKLDVNCAITFGAAYFGSACTSKGTTRAITFFRQFADSQKATFTANNYSTYLSALIRHLETERRMPLLLLTAEGNGHLGALTILEKYKYSVLLTDRKSIGQIITELSTVSSPVELKFSGPGSDLEIQRIVINSLSFLINTVRFADTKINGPTVVGQTINITDVDEVNNE